MKGRINTSVVPMFSGNGEEGSPFFLQYHVLSPKMYLNFY